MVYEYVKELAEHGKRGRLRGAELDRVRFLMSRLRNCGFSSRDVTRLMGGRWDDSTVRKYCKGSRVIDVSGRDKLLSLVAGYADAGVDLAEVERCRAAKKLLAGVGLDFEGAAKLGDDLAHCRGSVESVESLSSELAGEGRTVKEVSGRLKVERELDAKGLTQRIQLKILEAAEGYGDADLMLEGLSEYNGLLNIGANADRLSKEAVDLKAKVKGLERDKKGLEEECRVMSDRITAVNQAAFLGFDSVSLTLISEEANDLGGPYKVLEAIQKYRTLKQLDAEVEGKRSEVEKMEKEVRDKQLNLNTLKYALAEADEEYKENSDVRAVVMLLKTPRRLVIDAPSVAKLLIMVLTRSLDVLEVKAPLMGSSPSFTILRKNMKVLINDLSSFVNMDSNNSENTPSDTKK